jgi:hypothetical protein
MEKNGGSVITTDVPQPLERDISEGGALAAVTAYEPTAWTCI